MIRITVSLKADSPPPPPAREGVFAFLKHDFDTATWKYVPRSLTYPDDRLQNDKGYPEMVPFVPRIGVDLTESLQWFWVKQLILSKYSVEVNNKDEFKARLTLAQRNYIINAWWGLTKSYTAFTNLKGTNNCRDYIGGWNPDAELPVLWENSCGGASVELFDDSIYQYGYKVKTLKTSEYDTWKYWNFRTHPQFFTIATNSRPDYTVTSFHYLDGAPVPVPIISAAGYVYVALDRARILKPSEPFPKNFYP